MPFARSIDSSIKLPGCCIDGAEASDIIALHRFFDLSGEGWPVCLLVVQEGVLWFGLNRFVSTDFDYEWQVVGRQLGSGVPFCEEREVWAAKGNIR